MEEKTFTISFRQHTTSFNEAILVLLKLTGVWEFWLPDGSFIDDILKRVCGDGDGEEDELATLEDLNQQLIDIEDRENDFFGEKYTPQSRLDDLHFCLLFWSCIFAVSACRVGENTPLSWVYVVEANRCYGMLKGSLSGRSLANLEATSSLGKKGAEKRHAEDKAIREFVFQWLDQNGHNFKSIESTARAIAGAVAPVAPSTARRFVSLWKKGLRSTGRL